MTSERQHPFIGRQRLTLLLLMIVFIAPFISAFVIFNYTDIGRNKAGINHGDLVLPPRLIMDQALMDPAHKEQVHRLHGKWSVVYLVSAECDPACEGKLAVMRQIQLALGQDAHRLQRLLMVYDRNATGLSKRQAEVFPGQLSSYAPEPLQAAFKLTEDEQPLNLLRLYVIDPAGYLMMSYPDGAHPSVILKDLKRLLKYSRIG